MAADDSDNTMPCFGNIVPCSDRYAKPFIFFVSASVIVLNYTGAEEKDRRKTKAA